RYPIWGNTQIDGELVAGLYNVNLREISEGYFNEGLTIPEGLERDDNRVSGDNLYNWGPSPETRNNTVFIGNIPGHYLAIVPKISKVLGPNEPYRRMVYKDVPIAPPKQNSP